LQYFSSFGLLWWLLRATSRFSDARGHNAHKLQHFVAKESLLRHLEFTLQRHVRYVIDSAEPWILREARYDKDICEWERTRVICPVAARQNTVLNARMLENKPRKEKMFMRLCMRMATARSFVRKGAVRRCPRLNR
jgi:hypothetical protein